MARNQTISTRERNDMLSSRATLHAEQHISHHLHIKYVGLLLDHRTKCAVRLVLDELDEAILDVVLLLLVKGVIERCGERV